MKNLLFSSFISYCLSYSIVINAEKAVICKPVVDLIGQKMNSIRSDQNIQKAYNSIAVSNGQINSSYGCPRLHQALYNEIVDVIDQTENEICIKIPNAYYIVSSNSCPQHCYWTNKDNIKVFDTTENDIFSCIPFPIHFSIENKHSEKDVIVLTEPYYNSLLGYTFSAGTRFKCLSNTIKNKSFIECYAVDYSLMKKYIIKIPRNKCIEYNPLQSKEECIHNFVTLLKKWITYKSGSIPYVWGGTSFTYTVNSSFKEITKTTCNSDYSYYEYENDAHIIKCGFDCSGVILRAAQICGIPYFCKNTTTIMSKLRPLKDKENLSNGDLIIIKGHVMVVSNVDRNLLIEARSYSHGYGKLHEISLNKVFDGIKTYNDLLRDYYEKKPVKRKDKNGTIRDTFSNIQLFSMVSCF